MPFSCCDPATCHVFTYIFKENDKGETERLKDSGNKTTLENPRNPPRTWPFLPPKKSKKPNNNSLQNRISFPETIPNTLKNNPKTIPNTQFFLISTVFSGFSSSPSGGSHHPLGLRSIPGHARRGGDPQRRLPEVRTALLARWE